MARVGRGGGLGLVVVVLAVAGPAHASPFGITTRALRGPPVLPPLPGDRGAAPEPEPAPPKPATPTAKPVKPAPTPATRPAPAASPTSSTGPATPEPPSPDGEDGVAPAPFGPTDDVVPPQPEPLHGPVEGDTANDALAAPLAAELPGEPTAAAPRLPPPPRPPYRGTGLFIGAGVTFAVAVAEQAVGHVLVKRRCIDPIGREIAAMNAAMDEPIDPTVDMDGDGVPDILEIDSDAERAGELVVACIPGVVPAIALRVHSDIGLLATIGLATAAGILRAQQRAYDDAFANRPRAKLVAHRISGISLIATGVVTWFASGAGSWGWLSTCKSTRCAGRARVLNFTMRDASALLVATGGVLLGYAEAYRRNYDEFERERAVSVAPSVTFGGAGLTMSGRF